MRNPAFNWETSSSLFESLTFLSMCWQITNSLYQTIMETLKLKKTSKINTSLHKLLGKCWGCYHVLRGLGELQLCKLDFVSSPFVQYNMILSICFLLWFILPHLTSVISMLIPENTFSCAEWAIASCLIAKQITLVCLKLRKSSI